MSLVLPGVPQHLHAIFCLEIIDLGGIFVQIISKMKGHWRSFECQYRLLIRLSRGHHRVTSSRNSFRTRLNKALHHLTISSATRAKYYCQLLPRGDHFQTYLHQSRNHPGVSGTAQDAAIRFQFQNQSEVQSFWPIALHSKRLLSRLRSSNYFK